MDTRPSFLPPPPLLPRISTRGTFHHCTISGTEFPSLPPSPHLRRGKPPLRRPPCFNLYAFSIVPRAQNEHLLLFPHASLPQMPLRRSMYYSETPPHHFLPFLSFSSLSFCLSLKYGTRWFSTHSLGLLARASPFPGPRDVPSV